MRYLRGHNPQHAPIIAGGGSYSTNEFYTTSSEEGSSGFPTSWRRNSGAPFATIATTMVGGHPGYLDHDDGSTTDAHTTAGQWAPS
jgi:hypothetical protein